MTSLAPTSTIATTVDERSPKSAKRSAPWRGMRITFSGVLYAAVLAMVGLAALNAEANLLFLLFGVGIGAMVYSILAPRRMVQNVEVEQTVPESVSAGRPFTIVYQVRSRRRWLRCWSLVIGPAGGRSTGARLPRAFVPVLEPGEQRRIELVARLPRRGRFVIPGVRVTSRFPFGLFSCSILRSDPAEVTVYPAVGRLRREPFGDRHASGSSTSAMTRCETGHDEFYGLREYREGDNPRWVHWRRSAHTGHLVVREMMPVRPAQLVVLLDPWPSPRDGDGTSESGGLLGTDVERLISAAATAACDRLERGYRVGLICRAAVPVVIAPAGGRPQRQRLLHELALLAPGAGETLDRLVSRIRWPSGWQSRCMICATQTDSTHERVARFLAARAEAVMLLTPRSDAFDTLIDLTRRPVVERRAR